MVYRVSSKSARVTQWHPIFKEKVVERDDLNLIRTETKENKNQKQVVRRMGTTVLKAHSKALPFREPGEKKDCMLPSLPFSPKLPLLPGGFPKA